MSFVGFVCGGFICATLLERVLSSVSRMLSFSSRFFVLCLFLTQKQHRPFLKAISVPVVRVMILCMACLSVGNLSVLRCSVQNMISRG